MNAETLEIVQRLEKLLDHSEDKAEALHSLLRMEFKLIHEQLIEIKNRLKEKK